MQIPLDQGRALQAAELPCHRCRMPAPGPSGTPLMRSACSWLPNTGQGAGTAYTARWRARRCRMYSR
jgi:hypothetical protein